MTRNLNYIVGFVIVALALIPKVRGGSGHADAGKKGTWTVDNFSVVIARIAEVRESNPGGTAYAGTMEPIATIAGSFDSSAQKEVKISFRVGGPFFHIHEMPEKGSFIMVVLQDGIVYDDTCTFMPGRVPLVVLEDGLADSRIIATAKYIQRVRANPASDDFGGPATQPSKPEVANKKGKN